MARLEDEIAMALAVEGVRVFRQNAAIVVEVPHSIAPRVYLPDLLKRLERDSLPGITALLGVDMEATPRLLRLDSPNVVHVLVAGTTGCGKTELMRTMLVSLAARYPSRTVQMLLVDPKGRAFGDLGIDMRHLVGPVARGEEHAAQALGWAVEEMQRRDLAHVSRPAIVVAIDEMADLIQARPDAATYLQRLAQRGREAGIHLIAGTQKPAASVMSTVLRANFPARIVGRVATADDARIAAGVTESGAEKLLGRGDFLLLGKGGADTLPGRPGERRCGAGGGVR